MSVAGMTRAAFSANTNESATPAPNTPAAFMQAIADYIPSDVVGIYIFAVGVLNSPDDTARWALFAVGLLLVPLFVMLNTTSFTTAIDRWKVLGLIVIGGVAFTAWAMALPDTPLLTLTPQATQIGSIALAILAALLPLIAKRLGLRS